MDKRSPARIAISLYKEDPQKVASWLEHFVPIWSKYLCHKENNQTFESFCALKRGPTEEPHFPINWETNPEVGDFCWILWPSYQVASMVGGNFDDQLDQLLSILDDHDISGQAPCELQSGTARRGLWRVLEAGRKLSCSWTAILFTRKQRAGSRHVEGS